MSSISVENICFAIDGQAIVEDAMMDVRPGEFVGLVGPNGSGKSSLLRTIYRVLKPHAGLVTHNGDSIWEMSARETAKRIAVVAQERAGEFDFSVWEVVMMARTPHKGLFDAESRADRQLVEECLAQVNMQGRSARKFNTLSGGEKQRVLMARALAQGTKLLVLDEPTNHLDIRYQLELMTLIKRLGITTLAALHDLNLAAQYCDRIFMLCEGKVVASGTPQEVFQPERIRDVYQVDAQVTRGAHGSLHIAFSPLPPASPLSLSA
jgi:iron complex transport system ATP-binding protein